MASSFKGMNTSKNIILASNEAQNAAAIFIKIHNIPLFQLVTICLQIGTQYAKYFAFDRKVTYEAEITSASNAVKNQRGENQMKKITALVALFAVTAFAGAAFAASPEVIKLPASMGEVTFNHKQHQERLKDCTKCHEKATGGKIKELGKEWAHKTCKGCHTEMKKGPITCKDCHKK